MPVFVAIEQQRTEKQLEGASPLKRKAVSEPEGAPSVKHQTLTTSKESKKVELDVKLMSGESLATVTGLGSWTGADVQEALQPYLASSMRIDKLLHDGKELAHSQMLQDAHMEEHANLYAIVCGIPRLHLYKPCSAMELAERRDRWAFGDDENLCKEGVQHCGMETAPETGREVADAISKAADIEEICIVRSESDDAGSIVVISSPGPDPKRACLEALAVLEEGDFDGLLSDYSSDGGDEGLDSIWKRATLKKRDFQKCMQKGFTFSGYRYKKDKHDDDDDPENLAAKLWAVTKIMADTLTQHFVFSFTDAIVTAPVLFGGYASDGSIVGIVSSRVHT